MSSHGFEADALQLREELCASIARTSLTVFHPDAIGQVERIQADVIDCARTAKALFMTSVFGRAARCWSVSIAGSASSVSTIVFQATLGAPVQAADLSP